MPDPASIAEQVDAILRGRAPFFVMERYGLDDPSREQYLETYTVGRQGIVDFLEATQIRVEDYGQFHGPSSIFERNGKWVWLDENWDERTGPLPREQEFDSQQEARGALLDKILKSTHTGLDFMGDVPRDKYPLAKKLQPWWRRPFAKGL